MVLPMHCRARVSIEAGTDHSWGRFIGIDSWRRKNLKKNGICLERQVSYFLKATLSLKPATIALKIGHLAFQVEPKKTSTIF